MLLPQQTQTPSTDSRDPLMLHINRLHPPTLPRCQCEQKNTIWLIYHSANNLPIYISVRWHPPTSPQMSDWRAASWSWTGPLSDPADRSERATHCCVWKWTARRRSLQIKNDFSLVTHAAVICGPSAAWMKWLYGGGGSWELLIRWSRL